VVVAVDRQAAVGWSRLLAQVPENLDRAWIAITAAPRSREDLSRQHRLKHDLRAVKIDNVELEQWQYEVSGGGRIWYAIDDERKTLWITQAGPGHPKQTDRRGR
jgi:hypothetical protein